jgi:predicted aminopeptidase
LCVRNLTNPVSAAHPLFASAEPELSLNEIEVWCFVLVTCLVHLVT